MSEKPETVTDVLRRMECAAKEYLTGMGYPMTPIRFKCFCNELAAAVELEAVARSCPVGASTPGPAPVGNAAKMRAALERILEGITIDGNRATLHIPIAEIGSIAETALATPVRNCDRFRNADEALGHFINEFYDASDHEWGCDRAPRVHAFRWLFDMAREKQPSGAAKKLEGLAEELRSATIDWDGTRIQLRGQAVQAFASRLADIARELSGNPEQLANTAAMREALEHIIENEGKIFKADLTNGEYDCFSEMVEKARRALSVPLRNCDLYTSPHAAWLAWQAKCAEAIPASGPRFAEWLLSPADPAKPAETKEDAV